MRTYKISAPPYGNVAVVATLEEQDAVHKDIMVDDDDVVAFVEVLRALSANFARSSAPR